MCTIPAHIILRHHRGAAALEQCLCRNNWDLSLFDASCALLSSTWFNLYFILSEVGSYCIRLGGGRTPHTRLIRHLAPPGMLLAIPLARYLPRPHMTYLQFLSPSGILILFYTIYETDILLVYTSV
jgi:hypothetical protein